MGFGVFSWRSLQWERSRLLSSIPDTGFRHLLGHRCLLPSPERTDGLVLRLVDLPRGTPWWTLPILVSGSLCLHPSILPSPSPAKALIPLQDTIRLGVPSGFGALQITREMLKAGEGSPRVLVAQRRPKSQKLHCCLIFILQSGQFS